MVPAMLMEVGEIPLTANGKVDRKALPAPNKEKSGGRYVGPRDKLELELALIWQLCLGTDQVSILDSFFELGGSSLSVLRMVSEAKTRTGIEISVASVFQHPTIEVLAAMIRHGAREDSIAESPVIPLQPCGNGAPYFFIHPMDGQALCYLELAQRFGAEQAFFGIQSPGAQFHVAGNSDWKVNSIEDLAKRYIEEIIKITPHGPYNIGGWSFGGIVAFEVARQLEERGERVIWLAMLDAVLPNLPGDVDDSRLTSSLLKTATDLMADELDDADLLADVYFGANMRKDLSPEGTAEGRLAALIEFARDRHSLPSDIGLTWAKRAANIIRAHAKAVRQYVPSQYAGSIIQFRSEELMSELPVGNNEGLERIARGKIELCLVPGDHNAMLRRQGATMIANWFRDRHELCLNLIPDSRSKPSST